MKAVATDFGIQKALNILGVKAINEGTSTGSNWFSNGELIESHSPVNGELIGNVKSTTKEDYERVNHILNNKIVNLTKEFNF